MTKGDNKKISKLCFYQKSYHGRKRNHIKNELTNTFGQLVTIKSLVSIEEETVSYGFIHRTTLVLKTLILIIFVSLRILPVTLIAVMNETVKEESITSIMRVQHRFGGIRDEA